MIRPRQILDSVILHYEGQPSSITITLDGATVSTITDLPNHTQYKTRRVSVPSGFVGFVPQFSTNSTTRVDVEFVLIPIGTYQAQQIWHYYEVTYSGNITVDVDLDENNVVSSKSLTLPNVANTTNAKKSHTRKVYLPPLSFGYVPHFRNATADAGDIIYAKPVALPLQYYQGERNLSEGQITYIGDVTVQFYYDGRKLDRPYSFKKQTHSNGLEKYVTEKFYFPSGSTGHIFQWEQTTGDGDIAKVETDATLGATDLQPQVPGLGNGNLQQ